MIAREEIDARAARGAAWMDENSEGWHNVINLEDFDMGRCFKCAWGQVFGGFNYVKVCAKIDAVQYGFTVDSQDTRTVLESGVVVYSDFAVVFDMLTEAWTAKIIKRREAK